ncbi:MAG: Phasin [Rhodobacteraceae bacterium]|nr:Phasin [Paracoccaceae bacterium]
MAKTNDFTKIVQDMMAAFPADAHGMREAFRTQAAFGEKMTRVAVEAAEKSTEITTRWTRDTLGRIQNVAKAKAEPADYTKAVTDFASGAAELAAENLAAFAEVAKKVQMETIEIMLAAGKDFSEDATAAVKKATAEVTGSVKRTTAAAAAAAAAK